MGKGSRRNRGDLRRTSLYSLKDKLQGLLRIKLARERATRAREARKKAQTEFAKRDPKSLRTKETGEIYADADEVEEFWGRIWGVRGRHEAEHEAVARWSERVRRLGTGEPENMSESRDASWSYAAKRMPGWKAPGPDTIHGWWHRAFPKMNSLLRDKMWEVMDERVSMPDWMVRGKTVLIPKEGCTGKADQYRPIACLNTSYKLLTGALANMLTEHVSKFGIMPTEQKALRKETRGCLDALTVDRAIAEEAKRDKRSLSVAWVDYRKAFDLVPHRWVNSMLRAIGTPKATRALVKELTKLWATDLCLLTAEGPKHIPIIMKRGIFQGDSLSPLRGPTLGGTVRDGFFLLHPPARTTNSHHVCGRFESVCGGED